MSQGFSPRKHPTAHHSSLVAPPACRTGVAHEGLPYGKDGRCSETLVVSQGCAKAFKGHRAETHLKSSLDLITLVSYWNQICFELFRTTHFNVLFLIIVIYREMCIVF